MKMLSMQTPTTREEFENRAQLLNLLNDMEDFLNIKRNFFLSDLQQMPIEELLRLRSMPNGRMDLLTVDECVRLNANMMVQFDGMLDDLLNNNQ